MRLVPLTNLRSRPSWVYYASHLSVSDGRDGGHLPAAHDSAGPRDAQPLHDQAVPPAHDRGGDRARHPPWADHPASLPPDPIVRPELRFDLRGSGGHLPPLPDRPRERFQGDLYPKERRRRGGWGDFSLLPLVCSTPRSCSPLRCPFQPGPVSTWRFSRVG